MRHPGRKPQERLHRANVTAGFLALLSFGYSGVLSIVLRRAGRHSRKTAPVGMPRPRPERILIIIGAVLCALGHIVLLHVLECEVDVALRAKGA